MIVAPSDPPPPSLAGQVRPQDSIMYGCGSTSDVERFDWFMSVAPGALLSPDTFVVLPPAAAPDVGAVVLNAASHSKESVCCADAEPLCPDNAPPGTLILSERALVRSAGLIDASTAEQFATLGSLGLRTVPQPRATCSFHPSPSAAFLCRLDGGLYWSTNKSCVAREALGGVGGTGRYHAHVDLGIDWKSFLRTSGCFC